MDKKLIQVGLMGMNKDVINSKTAQQQAYEIKNFRLSATQDSNAFELTTERGTKSIPLEWTDSSNNQIQVKGIIIGYCILNNYLVLFTFDHQRTVDRIYRLTLNPNEFEEGITEIVLLYEGDKLEFDINHLIDAIPYYETELIQKVYWIDGIVDDIEMYEVPEEYNNLPPDEMYQLAFNDQQYDYEGDIELDEDVIYNSTKADMFVREYEELTHKSFVELEGKALDDFYQTIRRIRRTYKGKGDNGALFGEEEDYSINSDVTYSRAMEKIKIKMEQSPFKEIFDETLTSEHVARTYLMAKNIAENHRLRNQNAQYDIGSNILQRTPGGNDNTILLTDLQKITLERGEDKRFSKDADKDGIQDGNEMGVYKKVDITGFVEHMLKAESGLSDVAELMENYKKQAKKP